MALLGLFLAGCREDASESPAAADPPPPAVGSRFDATTAGTIRGRVAWTGPIPRPPAFAIPPIDAAVGPAHGALQRDNPNAPSIDPESLGVGGAVVFLRGVDPASSRPWDHPPVRVEQDDFRLRIVQQAGRPLVGFVRRGDAVTLVSRQAALHALHADGAAFFTLSFPDPDRPLSRRLDRTGVVELRSAATYYWMRGYLFVDDHPYYTTTDAAGRFLLADVPPGSYEAVCWLPDWHEAKRDLDPETCIVLRLAYRPPVVRTKPVGVPAKGAAEVDFALTGSDFGP
jgi:hypothetical protein